MIGDIVSIFLQTMHFNFIDKVSQKTESTIVIMYALTLNRMKFLLLSFASHCTKNVNHRYILTNYQHYRE